MKTVAFIGQPNVGKTSLLNRLTGRVATVSNYPGTTVEIQRARMEYGPFSALLIDTPGIYSLLSTSEEQRVTKGVINSGVDLIVHVIDACDLDRQLRLTLDLIHYKVPMIVVLNQADLAHGIAHQASLIEERLGVPVVCTSATSGTGLVKLKNAILRGGSYPKTVPEPLSLETTLREESRMERFVDSPLTGVPLLVLAGYLSLKAVVIFVSLFENIMMISVQVALSHLTMVFSRLPSPFGDVLPEILLEGIAIPFSVVLPSMLAVYLLMAILEDSGLLARFAVVMDGFMSLLGLPGNAIIPLCLALGCRVPALLSIRTIREFQDRAVTAALVCVAMPCAATAGMVAGVLSRFGGQWEVVYLTAGVGFLLMCFLVGKGPRVSRFAMEIPLLRVPLISNVISKTRARLGPFFLQVMPLLAITSIGIKVLMTFKGFDFAVSPAIVSILGIRGEALVGVALTIVQKYLAPAVLLGLDLSSREATIASAMVILSVPCLPASLVVLKEMGARTFARILMLGLLLPLAAGTVLNLILPR